MTAVNRYLALLYGVAAFLVAGFSVLAFAAFLHGLRPFAWRMAPELAIDAALLVLFGLQHSGMAREGFKRIWLWVIPAPIERSTYVLVSGVALLALVCVWQPVGGSIWSVPGAAAWPIHAIALAGVAIMVLAVIQMDFWELMGLSQVWRYSRRLPVTVSEFSTSGLYRFVRHPLMLGMLTSFWATPEMTGDRLVITSFMTGYVIVALRWEEADLLRRFGSNYVEYRRRVPQLLPWKWSRR
jgi:protein-S-isoprenylcysteine O-methyltransferase Ste14